jgi:hypothetical protein
MPDWSRFHAALLAGRLQGEIPDACERAWPWLDLPADSLRAQVKAAIPDEPHARWMLQALLFVQRRLLRDAGLDPDDNAGLAAFGAKVGAGAASPVELELVRRYNAAIAIGAAATEAFPAASLPVAAPDPAQQALLASVPVLTSAIHRVDAGMATPDAIDALRQAIDAFGAVGRGFVPPAAHEHAWWLGMAWRAVARGAQELGRIDDARAALQRAAACYGDAGDAPGAQESRERLRDLDLRVAGDFDSAAATERRALLVRRDPAGRALALTRLAREIGNTGDRYEAARVAEQAAQVLRDADYADPELDFDAAADTWIATASARCAGDALFGLLCQVAECWGAILGARASARLKTDPSGSVRAEEALRHIPALSAALFEQAGIAEDDAARRFALWCAQPAAPWEDRPGVDASVDRANALAGLDDGLQQLRTACNEAPDDAQLAAADALRTRAETLGSRVHVARAILERMYVLLALERVDNVPALAGEAIRVLAGDGTAQLGAFATGFERELYLTAIDYHARALAARRSHEALIDLCEPVIRDIEGERARVSSPYQQSAFLATRAEIYELVAAAAYRTARIDLLLDVMELLKARSALRSRLVPGADLPTITVAAVQQALAADEAALSWFWVADDIAIVVAITRDTIRTAVVSLDADMHARYQAFLACVTALCGDAPRYATLIPRIAAEIAALGGALLPLELRGILAGKSRLVVSPHRSLHLFPFHAIPWQQDGHDIHLIERFAIAYVPNLTSLLLPWHGNAGGDVLAVGVPVFDDPQVPPLDRAGDEAQAVAAAHGTHGRSVIGATRAQFAALPLDRCRCLHLATHASSVLAGVELDDPLQASLFMRDGVLSGADLAALPLRCELVVLAACHSGQRSIAGRGLDRLPGDDLFGLPAVLFQAGAAAVLGALWPVQDRIAGELLIDFHRAYAAGAAPDRALQIALTGHLADSARPRDVFYWAPFFVSALGRAA